MEPAGEVDVQGEVAIETLATTPAPQAADTPLATSKRQRSTDDIGGSEAKKQRKGLYFEFAKKKWENEDSFKLPDGTYWPLVEEGNSSGAHGTVICKLCVRHGKNNNFTGEGYQWAARFTD